MGWWGDGTVGRGRGSCFHFITRFYFLKYLHSAYTRVHTSIHNYLSQRSAFGTLPLERAARRIRQTGGRTRATWNKLKIDAKVRCASALRCVAARVARGFSIAVRGDASEFGREIESSDDALCLWRTEKKSDDKKYDQIVFDRLFARVRVYRIIIL